MQVDMYQVGFEDGVCNRPRQTIPDLLISSAAMAREYEAGYSAGEAYRADHAAAEMPTIAPPTLEREQTES